MALTNLQYINSASHQKGDTLITVASGEVKLWDVQTKQQKWSATEPYRVTSIAFSADDTVVATGSFEIKLWDANSGKLRRVLTDDDLKANDHSVRAVTFSLDGRWLASIIKKGLERDNIRRLGHEYREETLIKVWNAKTGRRVQSLSTNGFNAKVIAFEPQTNLLVFAGDRRVEGQPQAEIRWLDLQTGNLRSALIQNCAYLALPILRLDKSLLIGASSGSSKHGDFAQWDIKDGHSLPLPATWPSDSRSCLEALSLHANTVAGQCRYWDKFEVTEVWAWDFQSGQALRSFPRTREDAANHVRAVVLSPDGSTLATGSKGGLVTLWRIR